MSEKGWHIFHNDGGAHAKEWTEIENSAKILTGEHVERLHQMKSNFKTVEKVSDREMQGLNALSVAHGFDPHYLPPENLNTIGEYPDEHFKSKWHFYDYSPEGVVEIDRNTPANRAKIKEHANAIDAETAKLRHSHWNEGF